MSVTPLKLTGEVPVVDIDSIPAGMAAAISEVQDQLVRWGFMAVEVRGIGALNRALLEEFASACRSSEPSLATYSFTNTPQLSSGSTQGFFPYLSEVPRLSSGVPDPKEFIHISGALLRNVPPGAGAVFDAFPQLGHRAAAVFDAAFSLISCFGEAVRTLMPPGTPALELFRDATNLRVIRYRDVRGREVLAHEHSGIQMLGLQLPPDDQGLQYVLHDGSWVEPVIAGTDVVLCNIGRMLSSASGGRFRPSTHRVHCTQRADGYERLSSVLFAYPPHQATQWRVEDGQIRRLDATWGDFIADRFRGLGAAAGSDASS